MTNVLPAASAAGVGLDQVLGAMSTMTAQGEDAASAGTHLRATLLNLSGGTAEAAKTMADYGIQADQVKATLQGGGGITGAFDMLTSKIGEGTQGFQGYLDQLRSAGDDTEKFDSILASMPPDLESPIGALEKMVGGVRSFQAVLELTGANAGEFKDNVDAIGESMGNAGDKVQTFGEWANTTNGKMAQFKGSMSDLGITLGEDLLPAFTKFLDAANKVAQFMADHPAVADALAFSIGTVLVIALGAATVAAWNFTVAMLGTGIPELIALIALLAFGIYELTQHWQGFNNVLDAMNTEPMQHASENVRHAMGNVANEISTGLDTAAGFVKQRMSEMGQHISDGWNRVSEITSSAWNGITSWLSSTWSTIVSTARQYWNDIVSAVGEAMSQAWQKVLEVGAQIGDAFRNIWNTCVEIVRGFIGQFVSVGGDIVRGIISGVQGAAGALFGALRSLASNALSAAKSALGIGSPSRLFADNIGQHISTGIAVGISEHGGTIEKAVKMVTDPKNFGFSGIGSGAFSFAGGAGQFQGQASGSLNGAQFHLTVQGNVYGHGGIDQAAQDIGQQFLTMQRRGTLGFQLNV
jgi:TP901 family phage tail tape measure protein